MTSTTRDPSLIRPAELAGAFIVALLVHVFLFLLLGLWSVFTPAAEIIPSNEILVEIEPVPPPVPLAVEAGNASEERTAEAAAPPSETREEREALPDEPDTEPEPPSPPTPENPLFGWKTHGEVPGEAVRPPGPETEVHGLPPPEEGDAGPALGAGEPEGHSAIEEEAEMPAGEEPVSPDRESPDTREATPEPPAPLPSPEEEPERLDAPGELPEDREDEGLPVLEPIETGEAGTTGERTGPDRPEPLPPLPTPHQPRSGPTASSPRRGGGRFDPENFRLGGGFDDLQFESRDYNWSEYSTKAYFAVYRTWLGELWQATRRGAFSRDQSLGQLRNLDGRVLIRFVIDRQGNISEVEVLQPSSLPTLDQASAAALLRAILPPLPEDFPREKERATFRFLIGGFPNENTLGTSLYWAHQAGEF